jgi:hypothetical protein
LAKGVDKALSALLGLFLALACQHSKGAAVMLQPGMEQHGKPAHLPVDHLADFDWS